MDNKVKQACYLCENESFAVRPGSVRDAKDIEILECTNCTLVCLSSLNHIKWGFMNNKRLNSEYEVAKQRLFDNDCAG